MAFLDITQTDVELQADLDAVEDSGLAADGLLFTGANPALLGGDSDGTIILSAHNADSGGSVVLYGPTHGSKAGDIEFKNDASIKGGWDESADKWDFQSNAVEVGELTAIDNIVTANTKFHKGVEVGSAERNLIGMTGADAVEIGAATNATILSGSLHTITSGNLVLTSGNVTLTSGDLILSAGMLNLGAPIELTISGGVVTVTQGSHTLDTESDAGSDDLDTVNGLTEGDVIFLRAVSGSRTVVLKNSTGNIKFDDGVDYSLSTPNRGAYMHFTGGFLRPIGQWL